MHPADERKDTSRDCDKGDNNNLESCVAHLRSRDLGGFHLLVHRVGYVILGSSLEFSLSWAAS